MIKYQQHWSRCLWMFSPFPRLWQRADGRGHHWPLKETWQTAGWLSPRSNLPVSQFYNRFAILGWSVKLTWQLVFRASIQFFIVLDAAVQHITNHLVKVPVILMVQSSLLVFGSIDLFRQNGFLTLAKMLMEGNERTFCVTLNNK